jgi:hypothetical protein
MISMAYRTFKVGRKPATKDRPKIGGGDAGRSPDPISSSGTPGTGSGGKTVRAGPPPSRIGVRGGRPGAASPRRLQHYSGRVAGAMLPLHP